MRPSYRTLLWSVATLEPSLSPFPLVFIVVLLYFLVYVFVWCSHVLLWK